MIGDHLIMTVTDLTLLEGMKFFVWKDVDSVALIRQR